MPKFEQSTGEGTDSTNSFIGNISASSSSSSGNNNEEGDETISKDGSNPYKGFSKMKFNMASRFHANKSQKETKNNYNVDGNTYYDYRETAKSYTSDEIQHLIDSLVDDPEWWNYFSNPPQDKRSIHSTLSNHLPTRPTDPSNFASKASQPPPPHSKHSHSNREQICEFDTKNLFKKNKLTEAVTTSGDEHSSSSLSGESGIFCSVNDLNNQTKPTIEQENEMKLNDEKDKSDLENKL